MRTLAPVEQLSLGGELAEGERSSFCPVSDLDLDVDVIDVALHCSLAENQISGDLAVGFSLSQVG